MKLDNSELGSGAVGFCFGLFVVWSAIGLGLGTFGEAGAGYVMFYAGILVLLVSSFLIFGAIKNGGPTFSSLWQNAAWLKPLLAIAALVIFAFLLETLGFLLLTPFFLLIVLRAIDPAPWKISIPTAALLPLILWFVLVRLLNVQLPSGIFKIG